MIKRLTQLLFFVSFASYAHNDSKPAEVTKNTASYYGQDCNTPCCLTGPRGKRGPRGHRGHRGYTGPTGATGAASGAGLGEVLLTAAMLAGCGEGPLFPTQSSLYPYTGCTSIPVWNLSYVDGFIFGGAWGPFNVPIDLDNTKPVTAVIHILVASSTAANGNANIEVDTAYLSNNEIGGMILPATGYSDTQTSGDFTVTPPSNNLSNTNVTQLTIPISLNPTLLVPGDWAFISVTRIPAITNEFQDDIWLSTISIQYSRLAS